MLRSENGNDVLLKLFTVVVLVTSVLSVGAVAGRPLTLTDCISLAKETNATLVQLRTSIEKSNVGVTSAHSSYYPGVDLSSSYRNSENSFGGRQESYSTSIGLSYSIYDGGYRKAAVDAATANVDVAKEAYHLSEEGLVLQVKEAFFSVLQKQEQITLVRDVTKRRKEDEVLIRLNYGAGKESSPAVKEAEANLLQAQYDEKRAQDELTLAQVELNLLLGRPRRSDVVLEYQDAEIDSQSVESLIEEAMAQRPEILSAKAGTRALEAQVIQAKSDFRPDVSLSSSYGLQGSELLDQTDSWSAGVSLSLPIFDGFSRKAKLREATLSLASQSDRMRELRQQIEDEIEQAYSTWELARSIIEVNKRTLEAALEMYKLTKLQYEQGKMSYFFLQEKETSLTQAETTQLGALYNLRVSAAKLEKVCGRTS